MTGPEQPAEGSRRGASRDAPILRQVDDLALRLAKSETIPLVVTRVPLDKMVETLREIGSLSRSRRTPAGRPRGRPSAG